jgi:hypothetical protein
MLYMDEPSNETVLHDLFDSTKSLHISERVTDGNNDTCLPLCFLNKEAILQSVSQRLLDQNVAPAVQAGKHGSSMEVIQCRYDCGVKHQIAVTQILP